jgi:ribosomal protein L34E
MSQDKKYMAPYYRAIGAKGLGLSKRTVSIYADRWCRFGSFCDERGLNWMPAMPETIAEFAMHLNDQGTAYASVNQAICAVVFVHRGNGHPIDRRCGIIGETLGGIRRARSGGVKTSPVPADEASAAIEMLAERGRTTDWRNACIFAVLPGAGLDRAKLAGLDWEVRRSGVGVIRSSKEGVFVAFGGREDGLLHAETPTIPRTLFPEHCDAVEEYAMLAGLKPGEPFLRVINIRGQVFAKRLSAVDVNRAVKRVLRALARSRGKSREEARAYAGRFSSRSLRTCQMSGDIREARP